MNLQEVPYNNGFGAGKDLRKDFYKEAKVFVDGAFFDQFIQFQSDYCIGVRCGEDGFTQEEGSTNSPWIRGRWDGEDFVVEDFGVEKTRSFRKAF